MGFGFKRGWGWKLVVLLWGTTAIAGTDLPAITVLVNNNAGVSRTVLRKAELDAGLILRAAGIVVEWVDCSNGVVVEVCQRIPGANQSVFVLHIVPTGKTATDSVFGVAFLGENGIGRYCDLFSDRIEEAEREAGTDAGRLLGAVAAHELGHLLLGSHGHSRVGIMTPVWQGQSLRAIDMGTFLFTREQASFIRARLGRESLAVSSAATKAVE